MDVVLWIGKFPHCFYRDFSFAPRAVAKFRNIAAIRHLLDRLPVKFQKQLILPLPRKISQVTHLLFGNTLTATRPSIPKQIPPAPHNSEQFRRDPIRSHPQTRNP
ncbi:MAG: hypothetical protein LBG98_01635 [Puniceicoccales bacterium]|jgi:hypothetical protein|nr:hypothetical protein [Puniceicoccales bacterium]